MYFSASPVGPYFAATKVCPAGPKLVPVTVNDVPPPVVDPEADAALPLKPEIVGSAYAVVGVDNDDDVSIMNDFRNGEGGGGDDIEFQDFLTNFSDQINEFDDEN